MPVGTAGAWRAARRSALTASLIEGYARFYDDNDASHELTISLGIHPRRYDPETEFIPQMRRIVREIAHHVRAVPRRQLMTLSPERAPWMAGFFEATVASGMLFPHWHGVIALREGEEATLRRLLVDCLGPDKTFGSAAATVATRPVVSTMKAKPTFHLSPLCTVERYIAYATKGAWRPDPIHWTTADFLPPPD